MSTNKAFQQLLDAFTFDNIPLLASAALLFAIAYWLYIYSTRLVIREGKGPFPIWIHTIYFAHDCTWIIRLIVAAAAQNWHWFLVGNAAALSVWVGFESFNIYHSIVHNRQETWGLYSQGKNVTLGDAVGGTVTQIAAFIVVINVVIDFMGQDSLFQTYAFTIVLIAGGPGEQWRRRRSRDGTSIGLAILIVVETIVAFLPTGMFVMAMPDVFNTPWFYLTGVVFTAISISNLWFVLSLPPKKQSKNGPKPIW